MRTLIVIPSRYGSTRFPGKPLHVIAGRTLLQRVIRVAEQTAALTDDVEVVVATDDERIRDHAEACGAAAVMTDAGLPSGTDRARAAAEQLDRTPDFVVNLQGDAPFTPPAQIQALIDLARARRAAVVTPVVRLSWADLDTVREQKQTQPFSGTSCVRAADGRALWFSKTLLPAMRKETALRSKSEMSPVFRHIGLYGYTLEALQRFTELPVGTYEALEGLEQLRFLENDIPIQTVEVTAGRPAMWGVDTPEDATYAETLIARHGDPFDASAK